MSDTDIYTVGWICAITTEFVAAQALLDEEHTSPKHVAPHDNNNYVLGRIGEHNVVIALLPDGEYGTVSAASVARDMLHSFPNIRIGLMVGIGGGVPSVKHDIRLGDIVVSAPRAGYGGVFQYDFGKTIQCQEFQATRFLDQPPPVLRTAIGGLQAQYEAKGHQIQNTIQAAFEKMPRLRKKYNQPDPETDRLYRADVVHPPEAEVEESCLTTCGTDACLLVARQARDEFEDNPMIHYGLIASGNHLMKDAVLRDKLGKEKNVLCFEMEAAGLMNHFPCLVIRGICDYSDTHKNKVWQGYAAMTAAAYAKDLLKRIPPNKVEVERKLADVLDGVSIELAKTNSIIQDQSQQQGKRHQDDKDKQCLRDLLVTNPRDDKKRIEETKGGLLQDCYSWVLTHDTFKQFWNDEQRKLLWITGDPGKGKTMLLCGIINHTENPVVEGNFLPYFFCQATDKRINTATAVLRSLIYMLLGQDISLMIHIKQRYETAGKALFEDVNAWQALTEIFFDILQDTKLQRVHLVVDALDECVEGLPQMLDLISQTSQRTRAKWLVSSRNLVHIEEKLGKIANRLSLELNAESVSAAVESYIEFKVSKLTQLKGYQDDLAEEVRQYLSLNAGNTFLWVALVCHELADGEVRLRHTSETLMSFPPGLDSLYQRMMEYITGLKDAQACREILALASTVYRPINVHELQGLTTSIKTLGQDEVHEIIASCGSFLTLRDNVVFFVHQSAKDFLLGGATTYVFSSDIRDQHSKIFQYSLELLGTLKCDIYDLRNPGYPQDQVKVPSLDPLASIRYSCVFWVDHLEDSGIIPKAGVPEMSMSAMILEFLENKYLHWLEALSLTRSIPEGVKALHKLDALSTNIDVQQLQDLIKDAYRFVLSYRGGIEMAPLQVYSSALLFSPMNSLIRHSYTSKFPPWVTLKPRVQTDWNACLQTLGSNEGYFFELVAVSFDEQLVVSSSSGLVRIWDATSGQCKRTLQSRSRESVHSITFSHAGNHIALGTDYSYQGYRCGVVEIWDTFSGKLIRTLFGHRRSVTSAVYSTDNQQITTGSKDGAVRIWDVDSGNLIREFETGGRVLSIASFENRQLVASGYKPTRIWDVASGRCIQTIKTPCRMKEAAFSSDGRHYLAAYRDILMWDITSGDLVRSFFCDPTVGSLALSTDDRRIVAGLSDGTIRIWDATSGNCIQRFKADSGVVSVAFSTDRQRVVSGSTTVQIWNAATLDNGKPLSKGNDESTDSHGGIINQIAFSNDGQRIVSSSHDGTVKIWDARSGECIYTLEDHGKWPHWVVFSPDSRRLASSAHDKTLKIWGVDSGECEQIFKCQAESPSPFVFSPNSQRIAIVDAIDNTITIWNTNSGTCEITIRGDFKSTYRLVFSPDSQRIAAGSKDDTITIWDTISACRIQEFEASKDSSRYIFFLDFSTDGQQIICAVRFGSTFNDRRLLIKTWDIASGNCVRTYKDHDGSEISIDFSSSRHEMKQVSSNKAVRKLGISPHGSDWITLDGEALLWLPWEFRPHSYYSAYAVKESTIAIGTVKGKVLVIRLALDSEAGAVLRPKLQ